MSKTRIKVYVEGVFSHNDFRKDVFSTRSTVIYQGQIHSVKTEKENGVLKVFLTKGWK